MNQEWEHANRCLDEDETDVELAYLKLHLGALSKAQFSFVELKLLLSNIFYSRSLIMFILSYLIDSASQTNWLKSRGD